VAAAAAPAPPASTLASLTQGRWATAATALAVALAIFGPDACVVAGGSQTLLDVLLSAALLLFTVQIGLLVLMQPGYTRTLFFLLDVVGTAAIALHISWLLGTSDQEPMEVDRPLDGRSGSYKAVVARGARGAELGNRAGRYSWIARLINVLCVCFLRPSEGGDFGGVEAFRQQLMHVISTHVALLTVLLVVLLPLLSFMAPPHGAYDGSMQAWLVVLAGARPAAGAWELELGEFGRFYGDVDLPYGPYLLCAAAAAEVACGNASLWSAEAGRYARPRLPAARLAVHAQGLAARFDFSEARQREAWMNMALVAFAFTLMVLTTLFISRAISDLVLRPLQRMLTSVKQIALPILGDVSALGLEGDGLEGLDDEVYVLERIVQKLGKIAGIAAELSVGRDPAAMEHLEDEDLGVLQMMLQGGEGHKKPSASSLAPQPERRGPEGVDPLPGEEMRARLEKLRLSFEELDSWAFDVAQLDRSRQTGVTAWLLLQNTKAFGDVALAPEVELKFLQAVAAQYLQELPFHTWAHAVDVHHTLWRTLLLSRAQLFLTGLEHFALLVSAIAHDVGHLGLSNQFLVETGHELAVRYNDRSPLENMSCARTFGIASGTPGANIFETLSRADFFESRRICIEAILHTDMVHHFDMIKEAQMLYQMNFDALEQDPVGLFCEKETKRKVMNLFLHAADISNPCKPWSICQHWAIRCLEEFFAQGDLEKQLGIPVQMLNDRTKVNRPFSQINFIEIMIVPLEAAKVKLFPTLSETTEFLQSNMQEWNRLWVEELAPSEEEREKVLGRIQRASDALAQARQGVTLQRSKELAEAPAYERPSVSTRLSNRVSNDG